jgi:hypothetical protein
VSTVAHNGTRQPGRHGRRNSFDPQRRIGRPGVDHPSLFWGMDSFSEVKHSRSQHAHHRRKHQDRCEVAALAESLDGKTHVFPSCWECGLIGRRHLKFRSRTLIRASAVRGRVPVVAKRRSGHCESRVIVQAVRAHYLIRRSGNGRIANVSTQRSARDRRPDCSNRGSSHYPLRRLRPRHSRAWHRDDHGRSSVEGGRDRDTDRTAVIGHAATRTQGNAGMAGTW